MKNTLLNLKRIANARNKTLNEPVIKLLALEFEVNEEWLLTGEGSKTHNKTNKCFEVGDKKWIYW